MDKKAYKQLIVALSIFFAIQTVATFLSSTALILYMDKNLQDDNNDESYGLVEENLAKWQSPRGVSRKVAQLAKSMEKGFVKIGETVESIDTLLTKLHSQKGEDKVLLDKILAAINDDGSDYDSDGDDD